MRIPIKGDTLYHIVHLGQLVSIVTKADHPVENLDFITDDLQPLQVGIHEKKAGVKLSPHIHLSNTKVISEIQEVLYVVKGKIRVRLYTIDGEEIDAVELEEGDSIVQISMGHGVEIIEDARIFEVKQGPYPGTEHAKIYFKPVTKPKKKKK